MIYQFKFSGYGQFYISSINVITVPKPSPIPEAILSKRIRSCSPFQIRIKTVMANMTAAKIPVIMVNIPGIPCPVSLLNLRTKKKQITKTTEMTAVPANTAFKPVINSSIFLSFLENV